MQNVSSVQPTKNFFQKSKMDDETLERPVLYHHEILQFVNVQDGSCLSSWNFEIFNSQ